MTFNPLRFASAVNTQYLRYHLTASRLTDANLAKQPGDLVWPALHRESTLLQGPYVSLSRAFAEARSMQELVRDGVLHLKKWPYPRIQRAFGVVALFRRTPLVGLK